jgi:hypothetical protein
MVHISPGTRKILNPKEIVVGDVLVIRGGDLCIADCVLFGNKDMYAPQFEPTNSANVLWCGRRVRRTQRCINGRSGAYG